MYNNAIKYSPDIAIGTVSVCACAYVRVCVQATTFELNGL